MNLSLIVLAACVFIGMLFPSLAEALSVLMLPSLFGVMLFSLMQVDLLELGRRLCGMMAVSLLMVVMQMMALPFIVTLVVWGTGIDSVMAGYAQLAACAGIIFGTPAFIGLLGFDNSSALIGVVLGALVLPLILPLMLPHVIGLAEQGEFVLDFSLYLWRIVTFIVIPMGVALIYRMWLRKRKLAPHTNLLRVAVVGALVVFAIAVMDGVTQRIISDPWYMAGLFVFVLGIHISFFGVSYLCFAHLGKPAAVTAGMLSAYRNLGLLVAICGGLLPNGFLLFVGLWQIPMYLSPLILNVVFGKSGIR